MVGPRAVMEAQISERDWQQTVIGLLDLHGWTWFHVGDSRRASAAILDIIAIRPPRFLCIELKTEKGKLTKTKVVKGKHGFYARLGQLEVIALLHQCPGVECFVWRPSNYEDMVRVLG